MKKIILSIVAVAALFSCSKSDVIFDDFQQEIGFTAVASNSTKSVAGYNDAGVFDGVFPTNIDLYVFANVQDEEDGELLSSWNTPYFQNAKFKFNSAKGSEETQNSYATLGAYEGDPARYWPNVKTLMFAGYSDACGVAKNATMNFATNTLTIPSYTQDNETYTAEGTNDLMWFPCDDLPHSKEGKEVPAKMKHACSWITVKVKSDGKYSDLKLYDLTINGLYHTGKATCGEESATWEVSGDATAENLYLNATGDEVSSTEAIIFENTANNMIVIPQTPTSINVKYSFVPQVGVDAITETKTNLPLKLNDANSVNWESGKHYIYTITITATEILIDPYVENWTNYSDSIDKEIN